MRERGLGQMGRTFLVDLEGRAYRCRCCDSPLALADDILSRSFQSFHRREGRAYLFSNVFLNWARFTVAATILCSLLCVIWKNGLRHYYFINLNNYQVIWKYNSSRLLTLRNLYDLLCPCNGSLGFKLYNVVAHEKSQRYREGHFVLERWTLADDVAEEFNLDIRAGSIDPENP